jgi:hypothetical protein
LFCARSHTIDKRWLSGLGAKAALFKLSPCYQRGGEASGLRSYVVPKNYSKKLFTSKHLQMVAKMRRGGKPPAQCALAPTLCAVAMPPRPPQTPPLHPLERACFSQVQNPTGGGYVAFAFGKPHAARFSLDTCLNSLYRAPGNFIRWPMRDSRREEGGSNGQSVPLPSMH